jgi:hypothetical protein
VQSFSIGWRNSAGFLNFDQNCDTASDRSFHVFGVEKAMLRCGKLLLALAVIIATPGVAAAQTTDGKLPQPEQTLLKRKQLDALVAPIALYPTPCWPTSWPLRPIRWKWCRPTAGWTSTRI